MVRKEYQLTLDGKKELGAYEDGGKIDVTPGSKLELKIIVESLFDEDMDIKINDIAVESILDGIDDGDDLDDETNDFDLNPEREKEVVVLDMVHLMDYEVGYFADEGKTFLQSQVPRKAVFCRLQRHENMVFFYQNISFPQ